MRAMEFDTAASTVEVTDSGVQLRWSDGARSRFHALWLRDNCPSGGDKRTATRTYSVVDLDPYLAVIDAYPNDDGDLEIEYSDGHVSTFDFDWLRDHSYELHDRKRLGEHQTFRAGDSLAIVTFPARGSVEHLELLEAVNTFGAASIEGVPSDGLGTESLAALFGRVRETNVGRIVEIVVEPDVWDLSETGLAVDPHTEDPYRYMPHGCSFLHCLEASEGGDSLLVDGFAIAEELRDEDPDAFDLLSEIAVPFLRHRTDAVSRGEDAHLVAYAPIISLDRDHQICGIRFHERSMAPLDLEPNLVERYYRAFITFTKMVNDPSRAIQVELQPGRALVYDNQRVLHGRGALSLDGGRQRLRAGTVDRDQFHSRLRRLREVHERAGVDDVLPQGAAS